MTVRQRFVPMVGDSMTPTIRPGDLVAVLPGSRWSGDNLYVIEELGEPVVVRASSDFQGGVRVSRDNPVYTPWHVPRADFQASLLGTVFAVCRVTDHAVAREAGLRVQEAPEGWRLL